MSEETKEKPITKNNHYFRSHLKTIREHAKEDGINRKRLKEIAKLVSSIPERKISREKAREVVDKAGLTLREFSYFSSLAQARREIAEALEEGTLSPVEAEKWNKEFGFSDDKDEE